jgi:hypothetical protein
MPGFVPIRIILARAGVGLKNTTPTSLYDFLNKRQVLNVQATHRMPVLMQLCLPLTELVIATREQTFLISYGPKRVTGMSRGFQSPSHLCRKHVKIFDATLAG